MPHSDYGQDLFRQLHEKLVRALIEKLDGEEVSGETLRQARELLRDNGITDAGASGRPNASLRQLAEAADLEFPFPAD